MFDDVKVLLFQNIPIGNKFVTVANNKIVVWTKIHNQVQFYSGESDDGYTPFAPNAITVFDGFPGVFHGNEEVAELNI